MGNKPRYNSKQITMHLREIAAEAETVTDDGDLITNGEALARILWKRALGYSEKKVGDDGLSKEVLHTPESWAIQLIYERIEGKVPQAVMDDAGKITAAERVSELSKSRLNALAGVTADPAASKPLPPKLPRKKDENGG